MKLEQLSLDFPRVSFEKVYQLVDLVYMSPIALYDKDKLETGVDIAKDGTAYKFYTNISPFNFGAVNLGVQNSGESHKEYAKRMKETDGIQISGGFSSGSQY